MPPLNQYQIGIAAQTAKGAIATAPKYKFDVNASDLGALKETTRRELTGQGVDVGDPIITRIATSGGFTVPAWPTLLGYLLWGVLGAKVAAQLGTVWAASTAFTLGQLIRPTAAAGVFEVTIAGTSAATEPTWGDAPDVGDTIVDGGATLRRISTTDLYEHTVTPADDKPWFTIWFTMFSATKRITIRFEDCKLTQGVISGEPGQDVMCQVGVVGLNHFKLPDGTDMPAGGTYIDEPVIRVPDRVVNKAGVATDAIANFNWTINSAVNTAQTGKITDSYAEQGQREMTLGWEEIFTDSDTYEKAYYNADGTPRTGVHYEDIDMAFVDEQGVDRLTLDAPRFGYNTAPLTPNPNGEIARQAVEGWIARVSAGVALTTTVRNGAASYS